MQRSDSPSTMPNQGFREIEVRAFDAALGAQVRCGDLRHASAAQFAEIRRAWLDHLVLVFRGQSLNDDQLLALARQFGDLDDTVRPQPTDQPGQHLQQRALTIVSNVVEKGKPIGALSNVDLVWHTDMSYIEVPPDASILYALEVPAAGGETGFCNMYRALETLPQHMRSRLTGMSIKHDATHNSGGFLRTGFEQPTDVTRSPGPSHPVIRTHPDSGYDALFLGRRPYSYIQGLPVSESEALLDQLWSHAGKPELAWYHTWAAGDVVIWDNRCTMHRRNAFDNNARRIMHRTQIKGTRPFADTQLRRHNAHPRGLEAGGTS